VGGYLKQVNRMVSEVSKRMRKEDHEAARLKRLDRYLFAEMGFHGSRTDYYSRSNSYLNEVIDDREGLPIAVSVLYMELARRLGLKVVGVGLPGHFVVRFEPRTGKPQLIDPFDRGKRMTGKQAVQRVEFATRRKFDPQFLVAQSNKAIVERMLRNLMGTAASNEDAEALLRYVETILVLNPDSTRDRWGRAVLNYQTGRLTEALADAEYVLKNPPDGVNADSVRRLKVVVERRLSENGR
ncbi:MAG: SirB1 family protein, partial [Planctomycetaceae bacterium]